MAYDDWHQKPGYFRDITRHFQVDDRILDVGCGSAWMSDEFHAYSGLEVSESTVVEARARGLDVRLVEPGGRFPFDSSSFEGVILKDVLEHVQDPVPLVAEVRRVLAPGGRVFASSPDAQRWVWNDYTHKRPYTKVAMRRLFEDCGFEVVRLGYECLARGTNQVSSLTRKKRRPLPWVLAASFPTVRRNVYVLAQRL